MDHEQPNGFGDPYLPVLEELEKEVQTAPPSVVSKIHIALSALLPVLLLLVFAPQDQRISIEEQLHSAAPDVELSDEEAHALACDQLCTTETTPPPLAWTFCKESCPTPAIDVSPPPIQKEQFHGAAEDRNRPSVRAIRSDAQVYDTETRTVPLGGADTLSDEVHTQTMHRGVYLTSSNIGKEGTLEEYADLLKQSNGDALVFDVKGWSVYFNSDAPLANELRTVKTIFDLPSVIQRAHEEGIYTIARFIVAKDESLASRKPETQIKNIFTNRGIGNVWVDTSNDTVLAYNREILEDVIASGVDEVNFDYIRYPTEYDQRTIGLTGTEKADRIEQFLRMAIDVRNSIRPSTKIGISTFAILGWNFPVNFEPLGQDIPRFAAMVDVISPMAYPSTFAEGAYYNPAKNPGSRTYYLVYRTLEGYKELMGEHAWKLRPWIQGYYMTQKNVEDEIQAVYDAGSCGFTFWSAQNYYDPVFRAMGAIEPPDHCVIQQ
jgi:hypothetical protein